MADPETQFTADPDSHAATVVAVIDAPVDAVFRAYTEPDLLVRWWGPRELTSKVDEFDPRPGGRWRIVQTDTDGNEYAFHGVNHDVVRNQRIVSTFEFEGMPGHVSLNSFTMEPTGDGKTKVTEQSVFQTIEDRDGMKDSGMESFAPIGMAQLQEVAQSL